MLAQIKRLIPVRAKTVIVNQRKKLRYALRHRRFKHAAAHQNDLKIIVGAAETYQTGWFSTNEQWFDITLISDWEKLFGTRQPLTHIVAEHVFEHLTQEGALTAFEQSYKYLKPGGRIRIAVPDGNHPDPVYLKHVGIAGIGPDAADHKQLYTVDSMCAQMANAGFTPIHIEGYDADGNLIEIAYDTDDGFIKRSRQNTDHKHRVGWDFADASTSLIVDGIKPHV